MDMENLRDVQTDQIRVPKIHDEGLLSTYNSRSWSEISSKASQHRLSRNCIRSRV